MQMSTPNLYPKTELFILGAILLSRIWNKNWIYFNSFDPLDVLNPVQMFLSNLSNIILHSEHMEILVLYSIENEWSSHKHPSNRADEILLAGLIRPALNSPGQVTLLSSLFA